MEKARRIIEAFNRCVDDTLFLLPPFYTYFGHNIRIGKNVFVNFACSFMDRGSITLEDNVLVGLKVNLITTNHPLDPAQRKSTYSKLIVLRKNAWIGANTTIMPSVTIGKMPWWRPAQSSPKIYRPTASWRAFRRRWYKPSNNSAGASSRATLPLCPAGKLMPARWRRFAQGQPSH
jgi:hypothetical protein